MATPSAARAGARRCQTGLQPRRVQESLGGAGDPEPLRSAIPLRGPNEKGPAGAAVASARTSAPGAERGAAPERATDYALCLVSDEDAAVLVVRRLANDVSETIGVIGLAYSFGRHTSPSRGRVLGLTSCGRGRRNPENPSGALRASHRIPGGTHRLSRKGPGPDHVARRGLRPRWHAWPPQRHRVRQEGRRPEHRYACPAPQSIVTRA